MSKGMEMPVSIIIVLALAVLVLVAISAFFLGNFGTNANTAQTQAALAEGCSQLRVSYNCDAPGLDAISMNVQGKKMSLSAVCAQKGFAKDACIVQCGCPPSSSSSAGAGSASSGTTNKMITLIPEEVDTG